MRAFCETCCVVVHHHYHGMYVAGKAVVLESLPDGSEVAESSTRVGTSEPARVSNSHSAAGSKRRRAARPRQAPPAMSSKIHSATELVEISDGDDDYVPVVKVLRP
jgi:hypothetical protein